MTCRVVFCIFLLCCSLSTAAFTSRDHLAGQSVPHAGNDLNLYSENGKVGLKNQDGAILIPAEYDGLGWSNGQFSLVDNVTGYFLNGRWGLMNISNHRITKPEFEDLSPGQGSILVARKKLPNSVRVKAGCINTSGKVLIPFEYDGLRISSDRAIVYVRTANQFKHGLTDFSNQVIIPLQYQNIYPLGSLRYGVANFDNKTAIFSEDGKQLTNFLIDSISSFRKNFAIIYQNQRQGLIDREGVIKLEPTFREVRIHDDGSVATRQADAWLFLDGNNKLLRQVNADSIRTLDQNIFILTTAAKSQLTDKDFKPLHEQLFSGLREINGRIFFRMNTKTGIIQKNGKIVVAARYDELFHDDKFIRAKFKSDGRERWVVLDTLGNAITTKHYDYIGVYNGSFFPARNRNYWGAIDPSGKEIIACVHDSLIQQLDNHVVVKFKGLYGVINQKEDWIITPQPNKLTILSSERYLETTPQTKLLRSFNGDIIYFSNNRMEFKTDHLLEYLPSGAIWKISMDGLILEKLQMPESVEKIFPESEGYRAIKKDGKYGFIDSRARLRIANRYEDVKNFSEGMAPAKLLGKWGFINKEDNIAVQPVYEEVFPYLYGCALVKQKNLFGVVDKKGKLILPVRYDTIKRISDKHFIVQQDGLFGVVDNNGKIVINAKYDYVEVPDKDYIIVQRDGKWGLLTIQGVSTVPLIYDGLSYDSYHHEYIALRRANWETNEIK